MALLTHCNLAQKNCFFGEVSQVLSGLRIDTGAARMHPQVTTVRVRASPRPRTRTPRTLLGLWAPHLRMGNDKEAAGMDLLQSQWTRTALTRSRNYLYALNRKASCSRADSCWSRCAAPPELEWVPSRKSFQAALVRRVMTKRWTRQRASRACSGRGIPRLRIFLERLFRTPPSRFPVLLRLPSIGACPPCPHTSEEAAHHRRPHHLRPLDLTRYRIADALVADVVVPVPSPWAMDGLGRRSCPWSGG